MSKSLKMNESISQWLKKFTFSMLAVLVFITTFSSVRVNAEPSENFMPEVQYLYLDNSYSSYVYIYFDSNYDVNLLEDYAGTINDYLQDQILVSYDGTTYSQIDNTLNYAYYGYDDDFEQQYLFLGNDNYLSTFAGEDVSLKIPANLFVNSDEQLNQELIVNLSIPKIESYQFIDDKTYEITFNSDIHLANDDVTTDSLKRSFNFYSNEPYQSFYVSEKNGNIEIVDDRKIVISFPEPLTSNQYSVSYSYYDYPQLVDSNRVVINNLYFNYASVSPILGDSPQFQNIYVLNGESNNSVFYITFDQDIESNLDPETNLNEFFTLKRYPSDSNAYSASDIIIRDNVIEYHLEPEVTYNYYEFSLTILANTIKSKDGIGNNYINNYWYNNFYYNYNDYSQLNYKGISLNNSKKTYSLRFNYNVKDNTIVDDISTLKEKITVSYNNADYESLPDSAVIGIKDDYLYLSFPEPLNSSLVSFHVEEGALVTWDNFLVNSEVTTSNQNVTRAFQTSLFSDAPSTIKYDSFPNWTNAIAEIWVYEYDSNSNSKLLDSSEYTITNGEITINEGVFEADYYYDIYIYANGFYYVNVGSYALKANESVFLTNPVVTKNEGEVTAKVKLLNIYPYLNRYNSYNNPNLTIIFQLMDGNKPVSLVTSTSKLIDGTYSASFNVQDAMTKNYTVKTFVVNKYDYSLTNIGFNQATYLSEQKWNEKELELELLNNNNNEY